MENSRPRALSGARRARSGAVEVRRHGVGEGRAQHDELVLPLAFGGAYGAAYGAVEAPQLALGAGIHVAHAADNGVRLVVQVEAVADQLFEFDFGRSLHAIAVEAAPVSAIAAGAFATGTI